MTWWQKLIVGTVVFTIAVIVLTICWLCILGCVKLAWLFGIVVLT